MDGIPQTRILSGSVLPFMRYFFLVTLLLGYLMSNLMRVSGVVLLPPLAESLGLTAAAVGFLSSLFFYTYGASYGVWGVLVDNRGPFICCGLSLLLVAFNRCDRFIHHGVFRLIRRYRRRRRRTGTFRVWNGQLVYRTPYVLCLCFFKGRLSSACGIVSCRSRRAFRHSCRCGATWVLFGYCWS